MQYILEKDLSMGGVYNHVRIIACCAITQKLLSAEQSSSMQSLPSTMRAVYEEDVEVVC